MRKYLGVALAAIVLSAPAAWAHPGHGPMEPGLGHWATSPYHLTFTALFGLACVFASRVVSSPRVRRACAVAGGCVLAVAFLAANGRA